MVFFPYATVMAMYVAHAAMTVAIIIRTASMRPTLRSIAIFAANGPITHSVNAENAPVTELSQ